jgi:hypothetical protein
MRTTECGILLLASIVVLSVSVRAQDTKEVAPVPEQISTAKRVFVSNAGVDTLTLAAFRKMGDPDHHYNQFYGAMKKWGRYELVAAPADADLVFELRFTAPLSGCNSMDKYEPQLRLSIIDAKTHFLLWGLTAPVEGALRKATWVKNFDNGITALMQDLKKLANQPDSRP